MIKGDSKDVYNVAKDFYFKKMFFFWTFDSSKDVSVFTKNVMQQYIDSNIFNTDNNDKKCYLNSKSEFLMWLQRLD